MKIDYCETDEFAKDFKTLSEDIQTAKKNAIELYHLHNIDNQSVFQIKDLRSDEVELFQADKIRLQIS